MFYLQHGGASVAVLEISGSKGFVRVNGKIIQQSSNIILSGGDEVVFSSTGRHSYVSFSDFSFHIGTVIIF